jgi:hypothetical protein
MSAKGPDFMCVGMQKAGTGWLYDQLQHHPDFWMPPIKEIHYFDRPVGDVRNLKALEKRQTAKRWSVESGWRELVPGDSVFFERADQAFRREIDTTSYIDLFAPKADRLSGDITPGYSTLDPDRIRQIVEAMPALKVMLLVRDPIARAWSQIAMYNRRGKFDLRLLGDPEGLIRYASRAAIKSRSYPTRIEDNWRAAVPEGQFQVFFFDDIAARPEAVMREILQFLGASPDYESPLTVDYNRKAGQSKIEMSDPAREALIAHFREELLACRERYGEVGAAWCRRYGL